MSCLHTHSNIVYLNGPRLDGCERRTHGLNDLRVICDAAIEMQRVIKAAWPADYPVPPEVDRINAFVVYAIARARGGALKNLGERAEG